MFLQAVPPPIPPPPPPGLPLENEMILLVFGIMYAVFILYKEKEKIATRLSVVDQQVAAKSKKRGFKLK